MTHTIINNIIAGLKALEVKGHVRLVPVAGIVGVSINGVLFGIWDNEKQTFVD